MDPFSAIAGVIGLITSVIGIASSAKQMKDESDTTEYNRNLNERVFDREDSAWQRAVNDRSKAGLSISGLTSGAGAGGTVSQLQAPQSAGKMAELMKGLGDTSFGLAQSAYDRKLQQENFTEELELKKAQLRNDKLNAKVQRLKTLADIASTIKSNERENAIFSHNMSIAKGENTNLKASVYGSSPSELKELVTALVNNKDNIFNGVKDTASKIDNAVQEKVDTTENELRTEWQSMIGTTKASKIPKYNVFANLYEENGKYYLTTKNPKTYDLSDPIELTYGEAISIYNKYKDRLGPADKKELKQKLGIKN